MSFVLGELLIETAVKDALAEVKADGTILDELLDGLPATRLAQAKNWFAANADKVLVQQGFPGEAIQQPVISIVLGQMAEQLQTVGYGYQETFDESIGDIEIREGLIVQSAWHAMVLTENADLALWLWVIASWAIFRRRDEWTEHHGLIEPSVSGSELAPREELLPLFPFQRIVTLTAKHAISWTRRDATVVESVEIDPTYEDLLVEA